ncbi:MAG: amino acid adenylation domain-containing protein [Colwellia sp.]|nr:amino acid adenylation domain-containing protein [Colwellia sp.]
MTNNICASVENGQSKNLDSRTNSFGLSPLQKGMLLNSYIHKNNGVEIIHVSVELKEKIDPEKLQHCIQTTFGSHDVFNSSFDNSDPSNPVHIISEGTVFDLDICDLQHVPSNEFQEEYDDFFARDRVRGMDFSNGPLMRFTLIKQSEEHFHLIWTWHHILIDARPIPSLLKDVFEQYDSNITSTFKSKSSYRDYIHWVDSCDTAPFENFWSSYLDGFTTKTLMPSKRKASHDEVNRYGESIIYLAKEERDELSAFAKNNQVTLNTVCQAAWSILLSRHNDSKDVLFATTKTTRAAADIKGSDDCVGLCLATLPLRVKLNEELTVNGLLSNIREDWVSLRPYEQSSLMDIAKWSSFKESGGLVDSLCLFEGYQMENVLNKEGGIWTDRKISLSETTSFKLALMGYDGEELKLKLCFDNFEYDSYFAERLLDQLKAIFRCFISGVKKVNDICLLSDNEKNLLNSWNQTESPFDDEKLIHDLFSENALLTPDKTAVLCNEKGSTYSEIESDATKLAAYLQYLGMGPGDRIGVNMERSISMIVALIAVLKVGASYVPLDPSFPDDRLRYMAEDSELTLVLRSNDDEHLFDKSIVGGINVNTIISTESNLVFSKVKQSPSDIIYILYTSGSTGKPKGVQISHKAFLNFILSMAKKPGMTSEDKMLSVTTLSFDISGLEIYLPLVVGSEVLLATKDEGADGRKLKRLIESYNPTIMQATPATWRMLLDSGLKNCSNMKVLCGGEALNKDLSDALNIETFELWNMYGPTETTVWSTIKLISNNNEKITVGNAIDNTKLYVFNENMKSVPIGSSGDLFIGGDGVSAGYLNRDDLNKEVFIDYNGETIYKTGDLACFHEDGQLECMGRSDNQVKIRGFRIELGEIEEVLLKHSDVSLVAVVLNNDGKDKKLIAYIEPNESCSDELESEILALSKRQLPKYMVPSMFILKDKLPLTPNNKIDRKLLASLEIDYHDNETSENLASPSSVDEVLMHQLWKEVLNHVNICINDNFFDIGDSLSAVMLLVKVETIFHVDLPLSALVENNTIATLALCVRNFVSENQPVVTVLKKGEEGGVTVFCIPGAAGNSLALYNLAQQFDSKYTLLGLELNATSKEDIVTIPELSELLFKSIIERQPEGKYYLIGLCYGSLLSMEIAKKLHDSNREVLSLSLLDPPAIQIKNKILAWSKVAVLQAKKVMSEGISPLLGALNKKLSGNGVKYEVESGPKKATDVLVDRFDALRLKRIAMAKGLSVSNYYGDLSIYYVRTGGITATTMSKHSWDSVTNDKKRTEMFVDGGHGDFFMKPYSENLALNIRKSIEAKIKV